MTKKNFIVFLTFFNFLIFVIGFFLFEEHGASKLDATLHTYPAIEGIKESFLENIITYGKYGEASYPLHHIIFAIFNPFEAGSFEFRILSVFWSMLVIIFFYQIIKKRFFFKSYEILFLSSLLLLSPYFRTSAYWGMTENTGLLFMVLSIFFYNKLKIKFSIEKIFFVCLFSSLALYSRIQNIFICIFFYLELIINSSNKNKIYTTLIYFFFSIPAVLLIYVWGGFFDNQISDELKFENLINIKTVPRTFLVILSLIGFYSLPFLICFAKNVNTLIKTYLINFLVIFIFLSLIFYLFEIDILSLNERRDYAYGQGFIANYFYQMTNIQISYLLFSTLGLMVILNLLNTKKNKLLIYSLLIIFSFRVHFFTEYLDPLLFILAIGLLDIKQIKYITKFKNLIIFELFFILTLFGAVLL